MQLFVPSKRLLARGPVAGLDNEAMSLDQGTAMLGSCLSALGRPERGNADTDLRFWYLTSCDLMYRVG